MLMNGLFRDNWMDGFFSDIAPVRSLRYNAGVMRTDIREDENGYELDIALPGFRKEDVQAELRDGTLTVTAERKSEENAKYLRRESYYGSCARSFYVGRTLRQEDIKARFEDGILKIDVPKYRPEDDKASDHLIAIE